VLDDDETLRRNGVSMWVKSKKERTEITMDAQTEKTKNTNNQRTSPK